MDSAIFDTVKSADWHVKAVVVAVTILVSVLASDWISQLRLSWRLRKYPLINPEWGSNAQRQFFVDADSFLDKGVEMYNGRPFRVNDFSQSGAKLMLPPKYVDEVKSHPNLDFSSFVRKDFYAEYPGFEPFNAVTNGEIFQSAVRKELAQVLSLTIIPMAQELPKTLDMVLGNQKEWTKIELQPLMLKCVGRLTSRIFLGPRLMDDPDWQYISTEYTTDVFLAARKLNTIPPILRSVMHWFLPECRKVRGLLKQARVLIGPEVERRVEEIEKHGGPRRRVLDSVDWFVASSRAKKNSNFDIASAEISLAMASIHTTTRTIMYLLTDLLDNPGYTQDLRDECVAVMKETGVMDKSALFKMKKMDSFLRESMRLHLSGNANMTRLATDDVKFSDGTVVPKGSYMMIAPTPMTDPNLYPNPDKFDGYRFLRLREAVGAENKYQAVTTSPEFTFFGHGQHACPGRFFAANEIKLLFTYMLLYYDFKFPESHGTLPPVPNGLFRSPDRKQLVLYKSRTPELDMMAYCAMDEFEDEVKA